MAFVLLLFLPLIAANSYQVDLMVYIGIMICLSVGLNIVKGFAGKATERPYRPVRGRRLGIRGVFCEFWLALPAAVLITAASGVLAGIPSFRLDGAYLALATLGFAKSIRSFAIVTPYLGAASGFGGVPAPEVFGFSLNTYERSYDLVIPVMPTAIHASFAILKSETGRAFKAVREDMVSAAAMRVHVCRYELYVFVLSAIYASWAGSLLARMTPGHSHPNNFNVISGVYRPDAGPVLLDGKDITGWEAHRIAEKGAARCFQLLRIFGEMTVLENLQIDHHCPVDNPMSVMPTLKKQYGLTVIAVEHVLKVVMDTCDRVTVPRF